MDVTLPLLTLGDAGLRTSVELLHRAPQGKEPGGAFVALRVGSSQTLLDFEECAALVLALSTAKDAVVLGRLEAELLHKELARRV